MRDGMILAIAGGTPDHAALAATVTALLNRQLEGKRCRVVCNQLEVDPEDANTATNPAVVVEIRGPSTEQYDRGEKLRQYQRIASLSHVVLVAHDEKRIDVRSRSEGGWTVATAKAGEQAALDRVGCGLDVDQIYRDPLSG